MFRMWGKIWKNSRMLQDTVICMTDYRMSRTQMVFQSLDAGRKNHAGCNQTP